MSKVIAILCSDLHLSHEPPVARSAEPDWYEAMERSISYLQRLSNDNDCPVVCAGDIFNRWDKAPAELINWAIDKLPCMYAIPGQHDLPDHSSDHMGRTPYQTLVHAGVIHNIKPGEPLEIGYGFFIFGFPWGSDITDTNMSDDGRLCLAVAHKYIWIKNCNYTGASEKKHLNHLKNTLSTYSAAVFGDNHKGFLTNVGTLSSTIAVLNCGSFFRRNIDEINYQPHVGLLHDNCSIERVPLPTEEDEFIDVDSALEVVTEGLKLTGNVTKFLEELSGLGSTLIEFADVVKRFCETNDVDPRITKFLSKVLEGSDGHR